MSNHTSLACRFLIGEQSRLAGVPRDHEHSGAVAVDVRSVRRGSLAVLVLLVVEYGIGMYVNLYVTIPRADHGHGLGSAIANGPTMLSIHAVIGLLLGLEAVGVLAQAVIAATWAPPPPRRQACSRSPSPPRPEPASPAAATPLSRWGCRSSPASGCCATRQTSTCCARPASAGKSAAGRLRGGLLNADSRDSESHPTCVSVGRVSRTRTGAAGRPTRARSLPGCRLGAALVSTCGASGGRRWCLPG